MGRPAVLRVQITGDASSAQRALARTGAAAQQTQSKWSTAGKAMAGAFAAGVAIAQVKDAVRAASDLEQAMGGVEAVFGKSADAVNAFAADAANAVGLSKAQYASLATTIGSQLKNAGASQAQAAQRTQELVARGADMAAVFGGTASEAVSAMSSALKGEMDPIERYGVTLNAAAVKAQMAANGTDKLTGAAAQQAKQAAVLELIFKQTAQAQGKFASESNTLAGQQERMRANFENTKATLGAALLPVLTKAASTLSTVATFVQRNSTVLVPLVGAIAAVVVAVKLWAAAQAVWNVVMMANPIGLIILAVIALVAAVVLLWKKSDAFRNAVITVWQAVSAAVMVAVRAVVDFLVAAWRFIVAAVTAYFNLVKTVILTVWRAIVVVVTTYVSLVRAVITTVFRAIVKVITTVWTTVRTISVAGWNAIKASVLAVVNALKTTVTTLVNGIATTIKTVWDNIKNFSTGVWDRIKEVVTTPIEAIAKTVDKVWGKIRKFVDFLKNLKFPKLKFPKIPGTGGGKSAPATAAALTAAGYGLVAPAAPTVSTVATAAAPVVLVQVQIGERVVADMVGTVVAAAQNTLARRLTARTGVLR